MKNIKFVVAVICFCALAQIAIAQANQNNGRLDNQKPNEVTNVDKPTIVTDVIKTGAYPVDLDYNNGSSQEDTENVFYPSEIYEIRDEMQASSSPVEMAERINELDNALSNMQNLVEELKLENKIIRESLSHCCTKSELGLSAKDAYLLQNNPNPFVQSAEISYFVPDGLTNAEIRICNFKGEVLMKKSLSQTGYGKVGIDASDLNGTSFVYMLAIENEIIDSKVMILTK